MLMAMFEPGMVMSSVVAHLDPEDGFLMGLNANLIDHQTKQKLEM